VYKRQRWGWSTSTGSICIRWCWVRARRTSRGPRRRCASRRASGWARRWSGWATCPP